MRRKDMKWITVLTHRSYEIQIFNGDQNSIGYRINDPAFLPDFMRYNTVQEAVNAIDQDTK